MELPKIDLDSLPSHDTAAGLFGSLSDVASSATDDRVVAIMVYVYETLPPAMPV